METHVRGVEEREIDYLALLWYEGWQDAHAQIVPAELRRLRSLESFRQRLRAAFADTRVVGPRGAPYGFCITKGDELYQIYVSAQARGSGIAAALMADAEGRVAKSGVEAAWLACAIGNYPHGFMKNLVGTASVSSLTRRKYPPDLLRWRCGGTKRDWREFHEPLRIDSSVEGFVTIRVIRVLNGKICPDRFPQFVVEMM